MFMFSYVVYTTKRNSFIVPKDKFAAKQFSHSYEVDSPVELATRRVKLPVMVTDAEQIGRLLKVLVMELDHGAEEAAEESPAS